MAKCLSCNKLITKKNQILECSRCQRVVHATTICTSLSAKQLTALRVAENLEWTCNDCSLNSSRRKSFVMLPDCEEEEDEEANLATDNVEVKKLLQGLRKELGGIVSDIVTQEMRSVTSSLQFCSDKVDEFAETLEALTGKIKNLEKKQVHLENINKHMDLKVQALEQRHHELEQSLLARHIEIAGVPESTNDNLPELVKKFSSTLNLHNNDIVSMKRDAPRRKGPSPILVELRHESIKRALLSSCRDTILRARDVMPSLSGKEADEKIYVREALTPFNRNLLWQAKQDLADMFKYIWCKEGKILVRKTEDAKIMRVRSKVDLESLLSNK